MYNSNIIYLKCVYFISNFNFSTSIVLFRRIAFQRIARAACLRARHRRTGNLFVCGANLDTISVAGVAAVGVAGGGRRPGGAVPPGGGRAVVGALKGQCGRGGRPGRWLQVRQQIT